MNAEHVEKPVEKMDVQDFAKIIHEKYLEVIQTQCANSFMLGAHSMIEILHQDFISKILSEEETSEQKEKTKKEMIEYIESIYSNIKK